MRIQVQTTLTPLYGKVPSKLRRSLPVIDGCQTRLIAKYEILEPTGDEPALSIKTRVLQPYAWAFQETRFQSTGWTDADAVSMRFYPRGAGYSELRVYFRGLGESDEIVNEVGQTQQFWGYPDNGEKLPYCLTVFRIYSLYEITTAILAGSVLFVTVLLCILTVVLAVLAYRLPV